MFDCLYLQVQPFDPTSYYAQFYRSGADTDGRLSPFPSPGVATKYNGNVAVLPPPNPQSPQEVCTSKAPIFAMHAGRSFGVILRIYHSRELSIYWRDCTIIMFWRSYLLYKSYCRMNNYLIFIGIGLVDH